MPQQINLLDASLQRRRDPPGSVAGVIALAATLFATVALTFGLHLKSAQARLQAGITEASLPALQARVAASDSAQRSIPAAELARLRAVESAQERVRAALDSGLVGDTLGYSRYLLALSRQMRGKLWLTDFSVAPDGRSLELGGRMTDPRELPDYLSRLNAEPLFKGREFAQLSLKAMVPGNATDSARRAENIGPDYAEFVLRSAPIGTAPR